MTGVAIIEKFYIHRLMCFTEEMVNILKYYVLRFRDALFPPRTLSELMNWNLKKGKYSYLLEKSNQETQKAWRRIRKKYYEILGE
jgi:hypothetical protein